MRKYIIFLLCTIFCGGLSVAQGRIDKVIDSMESKPDVETTYTERRSPKKKKLMMTSRIFNFKNTYYFERLRKAFEEERPNSISAVKTKNQMTYRFDDDKGVSTYTLSWTGDSGPFTMVMTWRSSDAKDSSFIMDDGALNFGSGEFSMTVDELLQNLGSGETFRELGDGEWSISRNGRIMKVSMGANGKSEIIVTDDDGCPVSVVYNSDDYSSYVGKKNNKELAKIRKKSANARAEANKKAAKARAKANDKAEKARAAAAKAGCDARKKAAEKTAKARVDANRKAEKARREAAKARCEARAEARKEVAKARQEAAKARREAVKAKSEARRELARARAEAQKARAKALREAATLNAMDKSEKIYNLASRSRCRIVSPSGVLTEMSALDALDNDIVWAALEDAVDSGKRTITTTTISGSTTTVIIEPEPEKI